MHIHVFLVYTCMHVVTCRVHVWFECSKKKNVINFHSWIEGINSFIIHSCMHALLIYKMPFAERGSMVRLLADVQVPKVGFWICCIYNIVYIHIYRVNWEGDDCHSLHLRGMCMLGTYWYALYKMPAWYIMRYFSCSGIPTSNGISNSFTSWSCLLGQHIQANNGVRLRLKS